MNKLLILSYGLSIMLPLAAATSAGCAGDPDEGAGVIPEGQNRLALEKSPYLLQHKDNPVNWYAWGDEAFAAARDQDKPIFLSIGYSTCHWCHVMEHESFENDSIAALMNELYICIKVDREERPDVDHVYMSAVRAMTRGGGGWPLSVWLTPDLRPYYGGTYFPPADRYGRPGFPSVLQRMANVFTTQREEIDRVTANVVDFLQQGPAPASDLPSDTVLHLAFEQSLSSFDSTWGGFGGAPKFPRSMSLGFLMRYYRQNNDPEALRMVTTTLDKMAQGGMYDHVGGGFHRYSTDVKWLVPHFEKMLYDNALLAHAYLEAYQITKNESYARVAREIFTYLLRDMQADDGGFYAAEDADSEGEEGKFYVWSRAELDRVLGTESDAFCAYYQVTPQGNYEGHNILWTPTPLVDVAKKLDMAPEALSDQLKRNRATLLDLRSRRIRPGRDGKVLTSWNGLLLSSFALGYQVLGDEAYLDAAKGIAGFVLDKMWDGKSLMARWADGDVRYAAYIDDYAFVTSGLFDLYESSFEPKYLKAAFEIMDAAEPLFATPQGGYYFSPATNTELLARTQEIHDGAIPSGISIMILNHLKRSEYTGDLKHRDRADRVIMAYKESFSQNPSGFPQTMSALAFVFGKPQEIVIAGTPESAKELLSALRADFNPGKIVLFVPPGENGIRDIAPITKGKTSAEGTATAYVCRDFSCKQPTSDPAEMLGQMR